MKTTLEDVEGLSELMTNLMQPIVDNVEYVCDSEITPTEYESRGGFIPHSSNGGGFEIVEIIPRSSQLNYNYLEFGECVECERISELCGYRGEECESDNEGYLDAKIRIWFKFEGIEHGNMCFYLYVGGGNGDAPYFRTRFEQTIFETSFKAKTLKGVESRGRAAIMKLIGRLV